MSYVTFISEIKTVLETISQLDAVYDYPETKPAGFPFCIVTEVSGEDNYLDTTKNDTTYAFEIAAIMELASGSNSGYAAIRTIADEIISKIQSANFTNGYFHLLRDFSFSVESRGNGQVLVYSATLEIRKANTI